MHEHFEVSVHPRGNGIDHLLKNRQTLNGGEGLDWNQVHDGSSEQANASPTERVFNKFGYGKPSLARTGIPEVRTQGDSLPPLSFDSRSEYTSAPQVAPPRLSRESLADNPNNFYAANRPDGKMAIGLALPSGEGTRYNGSEFARLPQFEPAKVIRTSSELAPRKSEAVVVAAAIETKEAPVIAKNDAPVVAKNDAPKEAKAEPRNSQEIDIAQLLNKFSDDADLKLSHSVLPDGTAKTVQTASDFTAKTIVKRRDSSTEEKITDRYGRPIYAKEVNSDGGATVTAMAYNDEGGKVSPFVSSKRITDPKGITTELVYDKLGKVKEQRELA